MEGCAEKAVAGDWTILLARRAPTIKLWSLDARSEGQSSHPLVSGHFAHEREGGIRLRFTSSWNVRIRLRISRQSGVVGTAEKALSRNENHIGLCTRCSHIMPISILNSYDSVSRYGEY